MVDSIYLMTPELLKNRICWKETSIFFPSFTQSYSARHYVTLLICKSLVVDFGLVS